MTTNEAGWHRGRPVLSTASEDEDHIAFNNDHVKHDMNDGPNENEKTEAEPKRTESTYSETTPFVAVETAEVTGEEHPDRGTVNDDADSVETAQEAGGRHRGRLVLRTVNEDDDFIEFRNDLVEHDKNDGLDEIKNQAESRGIEITSTETTSFVAVETAVETGGEHSERSTANVEADRIVGEGHHARYLHSVAEAGSIVLHVSKIMNEGKKDGEDGEEGGETASAKETEEFF